jgi:HSP20 family protein
MSLREWSPATQVAKLDNEFEDILNHFMSHDWGVGKASPLSHRAPAIESFIDADHLLVRVDLPGVDPKDVEIKVVGSILTIRGSRSATSEERECEYVHREIRYGSFERAISIPKGVKEEDIKTAYRNGVLELTIPLGQAPAVRRVPLQMPNRRS